MYFISYIRKILIDEQALIAHQLAAILSTVKVLIDLEGGEYPTSNLIKPYIRKKIDKLFEDKPTYTNYRRKREVIQARTCFYYSSSAE